MTVIVAHDMPDAIRGMLKRWFIEPRPNVFVGTLNRRTHEKTIEYIRRNATGIGLLMINSYPNCQGYKIETTGPTDRKGVEVSGLWMVAEKWEETPGPPTQASDFARKCELTRLKFRVLPTCVGMVRFQGRF